jgi:hypothetical protein
MFGSLEEAIKLGEKKQDDGGVPVFEKRAMPIENKRSKEVKYEDVIWVTIFNKGDPKNIIERPMREADKDRWPQHWEAYKKNEEPPIDGIPLEDFPQITPAERMRCKQLHIRTVEDLVALPDAQLESLGGRGRALQKGAREYVAYREGIQISDLQEEMEEKDALIKDLEARLSELERKPSGNSTGSNTKRSSGNKPAKAKRSNKQRSGPGGKSVSASEDGGE